MKRVRYTWGPGGVRRGRIWQSSYITLSDYKWVDRYTIGSTTIDGEDYTLAMGYSFPGVLAGNNFEIPIDNLTPIRIYGVSPKPDREYVYDTRNDFYVYDYLIYTIFDHQKLSTTFGSVYPEITEALYRSAQHQYMRNTLQGMTRTIDGDNSLYRRLIKPVYSAFWIIRQNSLTITNNQYLSDGTYTTDNLMSRGNIAFPGDASYTDFWYKWQEMSELERRYNACPDVFNYILTDHTTKIKVPRKALVTPRSISWNDYQPFNGPQGNVSGNPNFIMQQETMISPFDGASHNYQPRWNTRAFWHQTYSSDEGDYVDDYYTMYPTSWNTQAMPESRIYRNQNVNYARLKPLIPARSSTSHVTGFAPVWYGPLIGFGDYYNILNTMGMTDFYLDNAYSETTGRLCLVLNGYECEYASLNEISMT